jgi:hypothetical protein
MAIAKDQLIGHSYHATFVNYRIWKAQGKRSKIWKPKILTI